MGPNFVGVLLEWQLTDSGLKALLPKEKKYRVSGGNALFVIVYPMGASTSSGGIASLLPVKGKGGTTRSVLMGRVQWKWTLKQAKDEVIRLDQLRKAGEDLVSEVGEQEGTDQTGDNPFIDQGSRGFLDRSKNKPSTVKDYRNMLFNQVRGTWS